MLGTLRGISLLGLPTEFHRMADEQAPGGMYVRTAGHVMLVDLATLAVEL